MDHLRLIFVVCLVIKSVSYTPNSAAACDHKGSTTSILQREVCLLMSVVPTHFHITKQEAYHLDIQVDS